MKKYEFAKLKPWSLMKALIAREHSYSSSRKRHARNASHDRGGELGELARMHAVNGIVS